MARDDELPLEAYAAISLRLRALSAGEAAAVLRDHRIDAAGWQRAKAHWTALLERDAEHGDGELLLAWAAACDALRPASELAEAEPAATPKAAPVAESEVAPQPAAVRVEKPSFLIAAPPKPATAPASPWAKPVLETPAPPSTSFGPPSELTFERYAALCAEISVSPERATKARAKHGLADEATFQAVRRLWQQRFEADPKLRDTWDALFEKYRSWLVTRVAANKNRG